MVHYCCVPDCKASGFDEGVSFHSFPKEDVDQKSFKEDVKETRLIAHHRIQVERAIGKVKNFHMFDTRFRIRSAGLLNQIWTDCCLLANFQDPLIAGTSDQS